MPSSTLLDEGNRWEKVRNVIALYPQADGKLARWRFVKPREVWYGSRLRMRMRLRMRLRLRLMGGRTLKCVLVD
jgi:hypothetical protein